jgi:hypothetical protein
MVETTIETPENIENNPVAGEVTSFKLKPRALIFKANEKDLNQIKDLITTQFPKVEIIYITTGPAESILRVTKSMPTEAPNALGSFYSTE